MALAEKAGMAAIPRAALVVATTGTATAVRCRAGLWPLSGVLVMPVSFVFCGSVVAVPWPVEIQVIGAGT